MYKVSHVRLTRRHISNLRLPQTLLDLYNPIVDLTAEERIEATARRVGLNMPVTHDKKAE